MPHLKVRVGEVGRYALLPGDPARVEVIARRLKDARHVASNREFVTWTGSLMGETVSVTSTGIGGPSAAIAVEELARAGADTFVRVGTSGAMQTAITVPTLGVINAAIRDEGTSQHYLPREFPAVADHDMTEALSRAARLSEVPSVVGVAHSKDSYYGQHEPHRMPLATELGNRWSAWVAGGAVCSEMEAATIFVVASVLRARAGAIVTIHPLQDGKPHTTTNEPPIDAAIDAAVAAMADIIGRDVQF